MYCISWIAEFNIWFWKYFIFLVIIVTSHEENESVFDG